MDTINDSILGSVFDFYRRMQVRRIQKRYENRTRKHHSMWLISFTLVGFPIDSVSANEPNQVTVMAEHGDWTSYEISSPDTGEPFGWAAAYASFGQTYRIILLCNTAQNFVRLEAKHDDGVLNRTDSNRNAIRLDGYGGREDFSIRLLNSSGPGIISDGHDLLNLIPALASHKNLVVQFKINGETSKAMVPLYGFREASNRVMAHCMPSLDTSRIRSATNMSSSIFSSPILWLVIFVLIVFLVIKFTVGTKKSQS